MKTLSIWEVRAEAGKKEPYLDVSENVEAKDFNGALACLSQLCGERVKQYPEVVGITDYEIVSVRLIQQVKTLDTDPVKAEP